MATTASFHFDANSLWVEAELVGTTIEVQRDGRRCLLTFPEDMSSFGANGPLAISGWSGRVGSPRQRAAIRMIRVTVEIEADFRTEDVHDRGRYEVLSEALGEAAGTAKRLVSDLYTWLRAEKDQFWLEPQHAAPGVTWMTDVHDAEGHRLPTGYAEPLVASRSPDVGVTKADVEEVLSRAGAGERPHLADELLADARFYAWHADQPNPRIAILLAAVATEVRIKTFLTSRATPEQAALVDLILSKDVSIAAFRLFDKGLLTVCGRSLRVDDRPAYKALIGLFEARNELAHLGDLDALDDDAVRDAVNAAVGAFRYLDDLDALPAAGLLTEANDLV